MLRQCHKVNLALGNLLSLATRQHVGQRSSSTLRRNALTGNWTIFATGRTSRPKQTAGTKKSCQADHPLHVDTCPFCTGNEHKTPPELLRVNDDSRGEEWSLRVIPNAFPAVSAPSPEWQEEWRRSNEKKKSSTSYTGKVNEEREAIGFHEVVVETPVHNLVLAEQDPEYMKRILLAWRTRGRALYDNEPSLQSILYFKNNGSVAGASLIHPHSQIVGLPLVPRDAAGRQRAHLEYYERYGRSVWEASLEEELSQREMFPDHHRIVDQNEHFIAFVRLQFFLFFYSFYLIYFFSMDSTVHAVNMY